MKRILLVLILALFGCQNTETLETSTDFRESFVSAFNNPECANPCWLGIEVGVTNHETVIAILEEQGIEYGVPGVIHLYSIPEGSVPAIHPDEIPAPDDSPSVFGDINIGQDSDDLVLSIDFALDLCVSTIVEAFGEPGVRFVQDDIPITLAYLDHQLLFFVEPATRRIDGMILHVGENMPLPDELQDWAVYADAFSGDCSDEFTEHQG